MVEFEEHVALALLRGSVFPTKSYMSDQSQSHPLTWIFRFPRGTSNEKFHFVLTSTQVSTHAPPQNYIGGKPLRCCLLFHWLGSPPVFICSAFRGQPRTSYFTTSTSLGFAIFQRKATFGLSTSSLECYVCSPKSFIASWTLNGFSCGYPPKRCNSKNLFSNAPPKTYNLGSTQWMVVNCPRYLEACSHGWPSYIKHWRLRW